MDIFRVAFREGFLRFLAFPVSDWTSRGMPDGYGDFRKINIVFIGDIIDCIRLLIPIGKNK